jgi:acyl-CoA reductase-like NAD-dependent aldehyde dehydrogenase
MPAPARGEIVRQIGQALREHQRDLGLLVTYEVAAKVDQAAEFLASLADKDTDLTIAALDGLIEGQRARALPPT